jgi:Cu/Ag efflux pump CusA
VLEPHVTLAPLEELRVQALRTHPALAQSQAEIESAQNLAVVKVTEGPALINRNMGKRRIVVGVNVLNRDLGGYVKDCRKK